MAEDLGLGLRIWKYDLGIRDEGVPRGVAGSAQIWFGDSGFGFGIRD